MSVLVVGSVAYDSLTTPHGKHDHVLGGSATYFSLSASNFTMVRVVAVVGKDFDDDSREVLNVHNIDTQGLKTLDGETFRWVGEYQGDMNEAITHDTKLNVLGTFQPEVPEEFKDSPFIFLANIDPDLQMEVLRQVKQPKFVACDTMNFWIESKRDSLEKLLGQVDMVVVNDGEARLLTGKTSLVGAAQDIRKLGPKYVIIKRGEYGALLYSDAGFFWAPAYPLEVVKDPTGAGDTFAGGVMGYIAAQGDPSEKVVRRACYYGSVMASFTVEEFSVGGIRGLSKEQIDTRFDSFLNLVQIDPEG